MSSEWRKSVRRPPLHRVNGQHTWSTISTYTIGASIVLLSCFVALLAALPNEHDCSTDQSHRWPNDVESYFTSYNATYPITGPAKKLDDGWVVHRFVLITDLDEQSKSESKKNTWISYAKFGELKYNENSKEVKLHMEDNVLTLESTLSQKGRAMELSDLKVFDGHLLSIDDRTGVIYRIEISEYGKVGNVVPWILLTDGPGNQTKGFKGEWMSVKDGHLYVGGLGKEWTTTQGDYVNDNPMWIKVISPEGAVKHVNWLENYEALRLAAGIKWPGYMIHESGQWSNLHERWFFMPRRASKQGYTEKLDETRGTNYLLITDQQFTHVTVKTIGQLIPTRGYSAFQFIPGTGDELILALKSEEDAGRILSYISVFNINGDLIMSDVKLEGSYKFEGVEFV